MSTSDIDASAILHRVLGDNDRAQLYLALILTFGLPGPLGDQGAFLLEALQKANALLLLTQRHIITAREETVENLRGQVLARVSDYADLEEDLSAACRERDLANLRAAEARQRLSAFKKVLKEAISGSEEALRDRFGQDA